MQEKQERKLYIKTYGCQMNVYDSERMQEILEPFGFKAASDPEGADMVILNTCHIREKATEKVYSELGRLKEEKDRLKQLGKNMTIVMAGCVAQAEGEEVFARAPYVDIVIGPESYHNLPELVGRSLRGDPQLLDLDFVPDEKFDSLPESRNPQGPSAFLTIQEGCDKFCTFCVVPYTRGPEFSRKVIDIENEAKKLVDLGALEINLLGQNVNAYHGIDEKNNENNLGMLIERLAKIDNLKRIRYTTSHPKDMHKELYDAHKNVNKLMPYLHLPIQSGSDSILTKMNRKYSRDAYLNIIETLKKDRPNIVFSSDFIVGFPGETDRDFEDTLDIVRRVRYDVQCFSFKYSPRPGTPASLKDQIPENVKSERLKVLQDLLESQQREFNDNMVGQVIPVLFDSKKQARLQNQIIGRSEFLQLVIVETENKDSLYGTIENVEITANNGNSLMGRLV